MRIIDTYEGILKLGFPFNLSDWRRYAAGIAPELPEKLEQDSAGYAFETQVRPIMDAALDDRDRLKIVHESFLAACGGLEERMRTVLGSAPDADVVFYLGLCNGAGWATELAGRPVILIGAEKLLELHWEAPEQMRTLIWHELAHLWHFSHLVQPAARKTPADKALWQLWSEGVATYAEQLLMGDSEHYRQDFGEWLPWCRENRTRLFAEYRRRMAAGQSVQDFFGDWCAFEGRSDVGYYIGCELVRFAARNNTPEQIACMLPEQISVLLGYSDSSAVNPDCPCTTEGCPRHGDCSACRTYHRLYARSHTTACGRKEQL